MDRSLLLEILAYCEDTDTPTSLLGRHALRDSTFVHELRTTDRRPTKHTAARVRAFMAANPNGIVRKRREYASKSTPITSKSMSQARYDDRVGSRALLDAILKLYSKTAPSLEAGMAAHLYPGVAA